jgi:hypothetical protein
MNLRSVSCLELTRMVKKGYMVTDSDSILASRRKHFSQLFNTHGVSGIRQTAMHTAEPLVRELSTLQFETATNPSRTD